MTVLSRALTAETDEERRNYVAGFAAWVDHLPIGERMKSAVLQEVFLNERTLFIAAGRGDLAVQGLPAHFSQSPANSGVVTPSAAQTAGQTGPELVSPPAPKTDLTQTMSIEELLAVIKPPYGLTDSQFAAWKGLGKGKYPGVPSARIEALKALGPSERYWLVHAKEREVPK